MTLDLAQLRAAYDEAHDRWVENHEQILGADADYDTWCKWSYATWDAFPALLDAAEAVFRVERDLRTRLEARDIANRELVRQCDALQAKVVILTARVAALTQTVADIDAGFS